MDFTSHAYAHSWEPLSSMSDVASGFEEILIDSGICAKGSIEKVITGKLCNRAIFVHKIVAEGLECLLLMNMRWKNKGKQSFRGWHVDQTGRTCLRYFRITVIQTC